MLARAIVQAAVKASAELGHDVEPEIMIPLAGEYKEYMFAKKVVVAAVKQSRKAWMPVVNDMIPFKDFIRQPRSGRKFIAHCYNEIERPDLFEIISKEDVKSTEEDITILIGPEGDFSIDEVRLAIDNGYESISLGTSRLRTETASHSAAMMSQLCKRI